MVNLRVSAVAPVFIIWQNQWLPIISLTSFSILKEQLTKKKKKKKNIMSLFTHVHVIANPYVDIVFVKLLHSCFPDSS